MLGSCPSWLSLEMTASQTFSGPFLVSASQFPKTGIKLILGP